MDTDEEDQEVPELVHATDEEDEEVTFFPVDKMLHQQVHAFLEVGEKIHLQLYLQHDVQVWCSQEHFFPCAPLSRSLRMSESR